jgi:uncharacterized membrane protein
MVSIAPARRAARRIDMPSRRDILIGAIVLVAAFAAALLWMRRPAPAPSTPAPAAVAVAPAPPADATATPFREHPRRLEPRREPSNVERASRLRRRARFPPSSRPIEDGLDPVAQNRTAEVARSGPPDEAGPHLVTFPTSTTFQAPAAITVYAQVVKHDAAARTEDGDPQEVRLAAAGIRGEVQNADGEAVAALVFGDDGQDGDAEAGDRFYTATLVPDPDRPEAFRGRFAAVVTAETTDGDTLVATTGFLYATPTAHLTGQYRDAVVDGHLQIEAEVAVVEPSDIRLEGTLASPAAVMLGYARTEVPLAPGTHWIPLTFWGLILREQNVDGPYTLFSVTLATLDEDGAQPSDVVGNAYRTAPHRAADFSDQPFNDPALLEAAERLEAGGG